MKNMVSCRDVLKRVPNVTANIALYQSQAEVLKTPNIEAHWKICYKSWRSHDIFNSERNRLIVTKYEEHNADFFFLLCFVY